MTRNCTCSGDRAILYFTASIILVHMLSQSNPLQTLDPPPIMDSTKEHFASYIELHDARQKIILC